MNKNVLTIVFIVIGLVILEFAVLLGYQKLKPINKIESTNNAASSSVTENPLEYWKNQYQIVAISYPTAKLSNK